MVRPVVSRQVAVWLCHVLPRLHVFQNKLRHLREKVKVDPPHERGASVPGARSPQQPSSSCGLQVGYGSGHST